MQGEIKSLRMNMVIELLRADRLIELRKKKGLYQKDIASHVDIDRTSYCKYESAGIQPSPDTIVKLAQFYDVSTDYLLGKSDVPTYVPLNIPDSLQGAKAGFHRSEFEELTQDEVDALALIAEKLKSARKNANS